MIAFLIKRRGLLCLLLAGLGAGAVTAHRGAPRSVAIPLVTGRSAAPPAKRARPRVEVPPWRQRLSLGEAKAVGDRLVQRLDDGMRIEYTLNPEMQAEALDYLRRFRVPYAALTLYRVDTGEVLVLAGHSARDPALGAEELALSPWAPAASVYKVVTAASLIERGVPPTTSVCYHGGSRQLLQEHLTDNPSLDRSCRDMATAVARSTNAVIGKLAARYLDRRTMRHWATRFGFDQPIPFALPVQISRARIPSSALDRARVAAGFWQTEISALHGAVIAGVVADGGQLRWPHLVRSVTRADGRSLELERAPVQRVIGRRTSRELTRMMTRTTTEGTARKAFERRAQWPPLPDVAVAGKTGSLSRQQPYLDYSWFVGFAPADRPEVAFAALLGNPPRWRIKAAAAARALLSRYFARQQRKRALHAAASVRPALEGH